MEKQKKLNNAEILEAAVKSFSTTDKPFTEWELDRIDLGDGSDTCLCSKRGIVNLCYLRNKNTGKVILVGNECVKKFSGEDYASEFRILKEKKKDEKKREAHKAEIDKIEARQLVADDWEKGFLDTIKNIVIKGWEMSERQKEIYNRIMNPEKKDVSFIDSLTPINDWEKGFLDTVKKTLSNGRVLTERQTEIFDKIKDRSGFEEEKVEVKKSGLDFSMIKLTPRDYQIEAYQKWVENNYVGSAELGTGTGKTLLGVMVQTQSPDKKILIVVPTEALLEQWQKVFKEQLNMDVGVYYGKKKDMKDVTIAVINSVRSKEDLDFDTLILDEGHRYVSSVNMGILRNSFKKIFALSATFKRDDDMHKELFKICPPVYSYGQKQAIKDGYLSAYKVRNVSTEFNEEDKKVYDELSSIIKRAIEIYKSPENIFANVMYDRFCVQAAKAISARRQMLLDNDSKIDKAIEVIKGENFERAFVFNEYIATAKKTYDKLLALGYKVGIYHSALGTKLKKEMLDKFRDGEYNIIVTVKALDEGIDVPSADLAVIVGRTSQTRQAIQRTGRILRKVAGKTNEARVYNVYVKDTTDESWVKSSLGGMKGASEIIWEDKK